MGKWKSTQHPISDVRDWQKEGKLEIQPDFQRRSVWSEQAKILLIDSILKDIPMPKIFIAQKIKDDKTYRTVIDGQQRITAILAFLDNKISLKNPYQGALQGKFFRELNEDEKMEILGYQLDFYEVSGYSEEELREMYGRVNRYTIALNKQELRRADFPGDFLKLSENLSINEYLDNAKIFTPANRKRLGDVEYTSELLSILINGIQDKKGSLDSFYIDYTEWDSDDLSKVEERFISIVKDIQLIFKEDEFPIKSTRFKQKSDFYSLFAAINELHNKNLNLHKGSLGYLVEDLKTLDRWIAPDADGKYGEYAVRCLSDANSRSSREWRKDFLKMILMGAYDPGNNSQDRLKFLISLGDNDAECPAGGNCVICDGDVRNYTKGIVWCWPKNQTFIETMTLSHLECLEENSDKYVWLEND